MPPYIQQQQQQRAPSNQASLFNVDQIPPEFSRPPMQQQQQQQQQPQQPPVMVNQQSNMPPSLPPTGSSGPAIGEVSSGDDNSYGGGSMGSPGSPADDDLMGLMGSKQRTPNKSSNKKPENAAKAIASLVKEYLKEQQADFNIPKQLYTTICKKATDRYWAL
jgi:hypothetical protein